MTALLDRPRQHQRLDFDLPDELVAARPADPRDAVRLLVAAPGGQHGPPSLVDAAFADFAGFLATGDLLVVNTSPTLAAAVPTADGRVLHLSTELVAGGPTGAPLWLVEVRLPRGHGTVPSLDARSGERLLLPAGATAQLLSPYGTAGDADRREGVRLWVAALHLPEPLAPYLARHGRPIRYDYAAGAWPLSDYQTIFARPSRAGGGSAEMPSAGRPFSGAIMATLAAAGVDVTPIVLHTGVSSQDAGEPPYPERFEVGMATADRVNATHAAGGRVVAVGTTVTRALETVTDERGRAHPGSGLTDLVITPARGVRAVDGMVTGWHAPQASHLDLLEAVAGRDLVAASYAEALRLSYRWHEFGDLHLLLPR